jgi:hypothetical protein
VGKTYLALAIAHEYRRRAESRLKCWWVWDKVRPLFGRPPLGLFDAIICISGQSKIMTPLGIRPLRPLKGLPEITAEIASALNNRDLLRRRPPDREQSVLEALKRRRILLILDALEEMDPEVLDFIRRVPSPVSSGSRVLITSRHSVNNWPEHNLEALDDESARRLIRREAKQRELKLNR